MKINQYKFSEIKIGLEASFNVTLDASMITKFLEISGDANPLHANEVYAKEKGFNGRVAYGMLVSSFYSRLVGMYLPGKFCLLQGIEIKFIKPVYVDDILTVNGNVHYINEAYKQVEIKAEIVNQHGIKVSKATIKVGVMDA